MPELPKAGLKVLWRAPVGMGFSSPVIVGRNVYCTDAQVGTSNVVERVHCFDSTSGKERWSESYQHAAPDWFFTVDQARGPGSTPLVSGRNVYALDLWGTLVCLETHSGHRVWSRNLHDEFALKGSSLDSSPLIEGEHLIVVVGGKPGAGVVALDRTTGREVWRALDEAVTWSSPIVITAGGVRQLIVWTQQSVTSLNPATGKVYWRKPTTTGGSAGTAAVATPVYSAPYLLVSGWMFQLDAHRSAATTLWPSEAGVSRRIHSDTSTPMMLGDFIYTAKSGGGFACFNVRTGEELWKTDSVTGRGNGASVHGVLRGEFGYLLTDRGELIQTRLSPNGYSEISRLQVIEPTWPWAGRTVAWAAPAFAQRKLYVRNDRELICFSLSRHAY